MAKRSNLSAVKRRETVLSLLRREETASVLARRYGGAEGSLYRWRDKFLAGAERTWANSHVFDPDSPIRIPPEEVETLEVLEDGKPLVLIGDSP